MTKVSGRQKGSTKRRKAKPKTHALTLTQENMATGEVTILPLTPSMHYTFAGREHELWMSINRHGEPLLRFSYQGNVRMQMHSHAKETGIYLCDRNGKEVGHYEVKATGEVSCTLCGTKQYMEPLFELMTEDAAYASLYEGVTEFRHAQEGYERVWRTLNTALPHALAALGRKASEPVRMATAALEQAGHLLTRLSTITLAQTDHWLKVVALLQPEKKEHGA